MQCVGSKRCARFTDPSSSKYCSSVQRTTYYRQLLKLGGAGNGLFHMNRPDDVVLYLTYYVVSALIGTYERFAL
jgi:hypothetical protein